MEILGKILGSPARVKIMRLFLLNSKNGFSRKDIIKEVVSTQILSVGRLNFLASIDFIKRHKTTWFLTLFLSMGENLKDF